MSGLAVRPECLKELDEFEHFMGWSFRQLSGKVPPLDPETLATKQRDLVRTGFDEEADLPPEFISPRSAAPCRKKKTKAKTCVDQHQSTRIYSKHDTGPTATRATTQSPSRKKHDERPVAHSHEPVDFVYDVNVRRKLREQIDNERTSVREQVKAKQTQLKAANMWLNEPQQQFRQLDLEDQCVRKQAWAQPSAKKHTAKTHPGSCSSPELNSLTQEPTRAASANTSRPTSSKARKSPFAPNVSMCSAQPVSSAKHSARQKQQQQQTQREREAKEVETTLDAFDERLDHWSI